MRNKELITNILLLLFIVLENLCLNYFFKQGIWTQGKNAICLFLSSILFGVVLLYRFYNVSISLAAPVASQRKLAYVLVPLFVAGMVWAGFQYNSFFVSHSIAQPTSDIIPTIQIMCERLVEGHYPYKVIAAFGYEEHVAYMPFHWAPLVLSNIFSIDARWIPLGVWFIAAVWLCIRSMKAQSILLKIMVPVLLWGSNYMLFSCNNPIVEGTVELMIAGYYMMLMTGMNVKSLILAGVLFSFCILSRYSLVLWLPLYAFVLYVGNRRRELIITVSTVFIIAMVTYVIPFLSKDWTMLQAYKYYDIAAMFEWTHLNKDHQPLQLFAGTGYAYFFYTRFTNMDIAARIKLLQHTELICCTLVVVIMGVWYWFNRRRIDQRIFLMGSFKIYLSVFLFLIQVPYEYLMCVGNFVSIAIFCEQIRYSLQQRTAEDVQV